MKFLMYLQANRERIQINGCNYFAWYDGEMCEKAKQMINEMKVEREGLLKENLMLKSILETVYKREVWNEIDKLIDEVGELKALSNEATTEIGEAMKKLRYAYIGLGFLCILVIFLSCMTMLMSYDL